MRSVGLTVLVLLALAIPARAIQWYEHYEAGLAAESRGAWEQALESFREAERFRPEPAERVRTYGNRFLFDYDPPFHAARCLVELGRWDEARAALARSAAAGVTPEAERTALAERLERLEEGARQESPAAAPSGGTPPDPTPAQTAPSQPAAQSPAQPAVTSPSEAAVDRTAGAPASADTPARLVVESTPPGAAVTVDGRAVGRTPLDGLEVPPGERRVRVSGRSVGEGWGSWEQTVDAQPGERIHVEVALSRPPATRAPLPAESSEPAEPARSSGSGAPPPSEGPSGEPSRAQAEPPAAEGATARPGSPRPPGASPPASPAAELPERPAAERIAFFAVLVLLLAGGSTWLTWWIARRRRPGGGARSGRFGSGRIGERIDGYQLREVLGRGGMATTYRAERLEDGRPVALKIPHETGDPTYLERFLREGRLGETLHHPGIVRIIEAGTVRTGSVAEGGGERPFLAMELLPGKTLREVIDEAAAAGEPLAIERCLAVAVEIAEALDYAHGKGVIHRDLKPENVMVLPDNGLKVMDFGVARVEGQPGLTTSRFFFGSPVYAAPELVDPRTIDRRVDLYSLGVLLYELLEGEPPFVHESIFKLLEMHQSAPLPAPGELPRALPPDLWQVVARLLAKDREERYGSAQELLVDLHRLVTAPASSSAPSASR